MSDNSRSSLRVVDLDISSGGLGPSEGFPTSTSDSAARDVFIRECSSEEVESQPYGGVESQVLLSHRPEKESREQTRARLERIVQEQRLCWAKENQKCPDWLDAELLFRMNYGPGTRKDVGKLKVAIIGSRSIYVPEKRKQRARVTLLDRVLAQRLYRALFPRADWKSAFATDHETDQTRYTKRLSPFDYDDSDPLIYPILWTEEFIVDNVWNDHYSREILGGNSRPPMYAVVSDMILLLQFLQRNTEKSQTVYALLRNFARSHRLLSLGVDVEIDWAARGYLSDLFNIVTCVRYLARNDQKGKLKQVHQAEILGWDFNEKGGPTRTWAERRKFPGVDSLRIPRPHYDTAASMGSLESFDAAFICSGPFRFTFTTLLSEHLTFSQNREIRLFFDGEYSEFNFPGFPGEVLKPFEQHALGRELEADTFYEEVRDTYSLLFTRTTQSKDIASNLFRRRGYEARFTNIPGRLSPTAAVRGFRAIEPTSSGKLQINILEWDRRPSLDDFQYFRPHIALLEKQMMDWKPLTIRDLFIPGYKDRFTWYTAYFGLFIGLFALFSLLLSAAQLAVMVIAWKNPVAPAV